MIGVTSHILDLSSPIFQPNFEFVDIPRLKVKPLYSFIEEFPRLTLLVEFEVTLLLNKALASLGIGTYDEGFYMRTVPAASDGENEED